MVVFFPLFNYINCPNTVMAGHRLAVSHHHFSRSAVHVRGGTTSSSSNNNSNNFIRVRKHKTDENHGRRRFDRLKSNGTDGQEIDTRDATKLSVNNNISRRSLFAPAAFFSLVTTGVPSLTGDNTSDSIALAFDLCGGSGRDEKYTNITQGIIEEVRTTLALPRDDESKGPAVEQLRKDTNQWVASYRRDQSYSGRISYSNMYSALNAIAGHYNSFGTSYPIPKKRLDRILQECDVAEKALARGR